LLALQHHPVFSRYKPFTGEVPPFCLVDFLGAKIRHEFIAGFGPGWPEPHFVENRYPEFDEEYFEWIDLCEAVAEAEDSFTMIELGAGFGRWSVRAALAMRQIHSQMPYRLIAVEAEPVTFGWMRQHFLDNGVDPDAHSLINAAVSDEWGRVQFYIGGPPGGPVEYKAGAWYGQALTKAHEIPAKSKDDSEYCGFKVVRHKSGWKSIRIMSISLRSVLRNLDKVDLIDIDIEGEELATVHSAIHELDSKAKRLHIGTHEKEIEVELRQLLSAHGWECRADYPLFTTSETPWGKISFQDGAQSWVNPRI
jgi:FkbM family methyltransferase